MLARFYLLADNKSRTAPQDAERSNVHEDYAVKYWCKELGCIPERLKAAVRACWQTMWSRILAGDRAAHSLSSFSCLLSC
jgi:hypothetical protein